MGIWRATVVIRNAVLGGNGTNTWHLRSVTDATIDLNAMLGWVEDFYTSCAGIYSDSTLIEFDGELVGVGPDAGDFREIDTWQVNGATAGGHLPPATCIVAGWRTDSGGRSGRGRTFLGPLHINATDGEGTPSPTALGAVRTAAAALVDESDTGDGGAFGVWSPQDSLLRDFTSSAVRDSFAVLRSRRD